MHVRPRTYGHVRTGRTRYINEGYKPFVTEGFVSAIGDGANQQPVKILRDNVTSQSLMLESILLLSERMATGTSVLRQGIGAFGIALLQVVNLELELELVSRLVTVGLQPMLPVEGVSFIIKKSFSWW